VSGQSRPFWAVKKLLKNLYKTDDTHSFQINNTSPGGCIGTSTADFILSQA